MEANVTIITMETPTKGTCKINPSPAVIGQEVNVTCTGFKAPEGTSPKLKYEIYEKDENGSPTLLKSTDKAKATFKITKPNIMIKVTDENDMSVIENIVTEQLNSINGVFYIEDKKIVDPKTEEAESEIHRQKEGPTKVFDEPLIPFKNFPTSLRFDDKFLEAYKENNISLEVVHIKKTPLHWANQTMNSDPVLVYLSKKVGNKYYRLRDLKGALHIFLPLRGAKPFILKGVAHNPLENNSLYERDKSITVHRLDIWDGSRGSIFLNTGLQTLRVVILEDQRPDFVHFLDSQTFNKNISYTLRDNNGRVFVYVGVLPVKKTPAGTKVSYKIKGHSVFCKVWGGESWVSGACQVGKDFTPAQVHCICNHLTLFSAAVYPVSNKIDFIQDVELFTTTHINFYAAIMVGILLLLLFILLLWGRIADKRDEIRKYVVILKDNFPTDHYIYLIAVYTGFKVFSGTTANVGIKIYGELGTSRAHILRSRLRSTLKKGYDDWFIIFSPVYLGRIKCITIWHDNSGRSPSWHPRSLYTRPQRIIIAVDLVLTTMLISMLFLGVEDGPADDIPTVTVSVREILISVYSLLLSLPLMILLSYLFRKNNLMYVAKEERMKSICVGESSTYFKEGSANKSFATAIFYIIGHILTPRKLVPVIMVERRSDKKRKFCLFFSWTLAIIVLVVCSTFIVFYGLRFGKNKSLLWMTVYLFGVLVHMLLFDPIKIILISLILAIVFKKTYIEQYVLDPCETLSCRCKLSFKTVLRKRRNPMYRTIPLYRLKKSKELFKLCHK
uniref:PLAT domain-containing protein n=1 Tax=Rhodnius prolixus TaxID=13249 RepID=T1H990_RHOPR